jgi:hypothetical protein
MNITRRKALGLMGAVAVPSAAIAGVALATSRTDAHLVLTPEQEVDRLVLELHVAMRQVHGKCRLIRCEDSATITFCPPPRPRTVEFAGAGRYEVDDCGIRPLMWVERAPQFDSLTDGRCFKAVPEPRQLKTRYYYEVHLRTILVRKAGGIA